MPVKYPNVSPTGEHLVIIEEYIEGRVMDHVTMTPMATKHYRTLWSYDSRDPLAISMRILDSDGGPWVFGRELLTTGVRKATGHGLVRFNPSSPTGLLIMWLCVENSHYPIGLGHHDINIFVAKITRAVPDPEVVISDAELEALLT